MEDKVGTTCATSGDPSGCVGDPISASGLFRISCVGAPDKKVKEKGMLFSQRVAKLTKKLYH
jgi:hypothetical protein